MNENSKLVSKLLSQTFVLPTETRLLIRKACVFFEEASMGDLDDKRRKKLERAGVATLLRGFGVKS